MIEDERELLEEYARLDQAARASTVYARAIGEIIWWQAHFRSLAIRGELERRGYVLSGHFPPVWVRKQGWTTGPTKT